MSTPLTADPEPSLIDISREASVIVQVPANLLPFLDAIDTKHIVIVYEVLFVEVFREYAVLQIAPLAILLECEEAVERLIYLIHLARNNDLSSTRKEALVPAPAAQKTISHKMD